MKDFTELGMMTLENVADNEGALTMLAVSVMFFTLFLLYLYLHIYYYIKFKVIRRA